MANNEKPTYSTDDKLDAVRRVIIGQESAAAVGRDIGAHFNSIHGWVRQYSSIIREQLMQDTSSHSLTGGSSDSSAHHSAIQDDSRTTGKKANMGSGGSSGEMALASKERTRNRLHKQHLQRLGSVKRNLQRLATSGDFGASPGQSKASAAKALVEALARLYDEEKAAHGIDDTGPADRLVVVEVPQRVTVEEWQAQQAAAIAGVAPGEREN